MNNPLICPRCQFRLPAGGHICRTCGFTVAKKEARPTNESKPRPAPDWTNVFNFNQPAQEKRRDEPALGGS